MKKIFVFLIALLVSGALFATIAKVDTIYYDFNESDYTATVQRSDDYKYAGQKPTVIPAMVDYNGHTYAVTAIGDAAFRGIGMGNIRLSEGLLSIGTEAFQECYLPVIPQLPSTLTSIGNYAFDGNSTASSTVNIPANVKTIGEYAFYNCSSLDTIAFDADSKLETIGKYAFSNTKTYSIISLPATVTSIGTAAFKHVTYLSKMYIHASIPPTLIGEGIFSDANGMIPEIYVPLTSLDSYKSAWPSYASQIKANAAYTITFKEYDGTVLEATTWQYQEIPFCNNRTGKPASAEHSYTFEGWKRESTNTMGIVPVVGEETYIATYSEHPRTYMVTFVDTEGNILLSKGQSYGSIAEYIGDEPTKNNLEFAGWTPELTTVTSDVTYTAVFKARVIFNDEWGTEWQSSLWTVGETPVYSGETPYKDADAQYTYTFKQWPAISVATQNTTYTAVFDKTINKYRIAFLSADGEQVLQDEQLEYGAMPEWKGGDLTYSKDAAVYYHTGWTPDIHAVDGEQLYYAKFNTVERFYVRFYGCDGITILKEGWVEKGQDAEAPTESGEEHRNIDGWDKDFTNVQAGLDVYAECSYDQFTVTIVAEHGRVEAREVLEGGASGEIVDLSNKVDYGTMLRLTAIADDHWQFDHWTNYADDPGYIVVNEDVTITATFVPDYTGLNNTPVNTETQKFFRDGHLFILRGDKTYTVTGQEVR